MARSKGLPPPHQQPPGGCDPSPGPADAGSDKARTLKARRARREVRPRTEILIAPGSQWPRNLDGVMREVILPALLDLVLAPKD